MSTPAAFNLTAEIFTGNYATVNDAYDSTKLNNGARVPLGTRTFVLDSSGRRLKIAYVRLNSTVAPTLVLGPVYWKDNTFTIVTAVGSEGFAVRNVVAGFIANVSATNGNYIWIVTAGYQAQVVSPGSVAIGDALSGAASAQTLVRTAANTAPTNQVAAWALTAVASSKCDVNVACESM